jgi:hypothetical protein
MYKTGRQDYSSKTVMCLYCSAILDRTQNDALFVERAVKSHYGIGLHIGRD